MITKDNNLKVIEIFFKNPNKSFHIRELSRITGLSPPGIIKIIKKLKKEGLLISKKEKVTEEVKPNFANRFYLIKRLYNFYSLYESGLINYLRGFYEEPQAIILFGSYSKGSDTEKSDIDLCILSNKKNLPDLTNFEKRLNRKINIINSDIDNMKKEFKNSLANGIVLEGYIELIK
jgi:predicted nucleotidyltransferase